MPIDHKRQVPPLSDAGEQEAECVCVNMNVNVCAANTYANICYLFSYSHSPAQLYIL